MAALSVYDAGFISPAQRCQDALDFVTVIGLALLSSYWPAPFPWGGADRSPGAGLRDQKTSRDGSDASDREKCQVYKILRTTWEKRCF